MGEKVGEGEVGVLLGKRSLQLRGGGGGGCKVNVIFKEPPILYLESSGFTLIFNFLMVKFSFLWS